MTERLRLTPAALPPAPQSIFAEMKSRGRVCAG